MGPRILELRLRKIFSVNIPGNAPDTTKQPVNCESKSTPISWGKVSCQRQLKRKRSSTHSIEYWKPYLDLQVIFFLFSPLSFSVFIHTYKKDQILSLWLMYSGPIAKDPSKSYYHGIKRDQPSQRQDSDVQADCLHRLRHLPFFPSGQDRRSHVPCQRSHRQGA